MRYVLARAKKDAEASAYRIYVADTLYFMANGKAPSTRFSEFLHPKPPETRTAEEVKSSMKSKLKALEASAWT